MSGNLTYPKLASLWYFNYSGNVQKDFRQRESESLAIPLGTESQCSSNSGMTLGLPRSATYEPHIPSDQINCYLEDSNTEVLISTHGISGHDTGFESEGLEQYGPWEGLAQQQQTGQMQTQEDGQQVCLWSQSQRVKDCSPTDQVSWSKSPFSITGHAN